MSVLSKVWVPLVVIVAVTLGAVAVVKLRDAFGSEPIFSASGTVAQPLSPIFVKHVTYDVYGPEGTSGSVSYLDMNASVQQAHFTTLPWRLTLSTTASAVMASVVAQGDSDIIGCRITVNGVVGDDRSVDGHPAQTSCLVKAA